MHYVSSIKTVNKTEDFILFTYFFSPIFLQRGFISPVVTKHKTHYNVEEK